MSRSFDKLVALLKELFQLDRPDLDFGFYRIMHAKSAEVTGFLEQDLLPQVQAALSQYRSADKAAIEKELGEYRPATLSGTDGDDFLSGGVENDSLARLAGEDTLAGRRGHGALLGGAGNETPCTGTQQPAPATPRKPRPTIPWTEGRGTIPCTAAPGRVGFKWIHYPVK